MGERSGSLVLLHDPSVLATRTGEIARLVARAVKQPIPDVAQRVRYGGGILARDVAPEVAAKVVGDLAVLEVEAFVVSEESNCLVLPRTRRVAGLAFGPEGLVGSIRGSTKREEIPWSRLRAVHVDAFARELSPEEVEEGRPTRALPDVKRVPEEILRFTSEVALYEDRERTRRIELCLDLIAEDPLLVARISADEADYSGLEAKGDNALANFMTLIRQLLAALPKKVVVPPATRRFAESLDWRGILVEKPEQRDAFNLWFAHAVHHGRPYGVDAAALAALEDASEVHDDELEDADEALVVEEHEDSSDAEDLADDETHDEDDEGDGEDEGEDDAKAKAVAGADADVKHALGHFDKTRKLRKADVAELVAAAQAMDDKAIETADGEVAGADVANELAFFEDKKGETGRFDLNELVKDSQALEDAEVADEKSLVDEKKDPADEKNNPGA